MLGKFFKKEEIKNRNKAGSEPRGSIAPDETEGQLAIDVYQTPDEVVVESTIAGVKIGDLDIDVTGESVTIKGQRQRDSKVIDNDYFWQECYWGKFSRSIILPQEVDPDRAHFTLKRGVLTVHLPKVHRDRARKIPGKEIKEE